MIGAVPDTQTRSPTRTAREYPTRCSNAAPDETSCRSTRLVSRFVQALRQVDGWGCGVAVGVVGRTRGVHGDTERRFPWASVTKLATALAMLVALEEGLADLDEPTGPLGSTFRHLLAHASGLPFEAGAPIAPPGRRRIYSNYGFEVAAAFVAARAEELRAPRRVAAETLAEAATVQFPGLDGVLPGFGRQSPNDWGLGFELR